MNDVTTEAVAAAPKTTEELLVIAKARVAKLEQRLLTEQLLNNVEANDEVTIKFGRGDKVRHIAGKVVATALPTLVVVDDELNTYKVQVRDIISNPTADARRGDGVAVVAETNGDPTTDEAVDEFDAATAGEDPLENA